MTDSNVIYLDTLSFTSLYLKAYFNDQHLGYGTGFVVVRGERTFLITARHVLTGRHADTGKPLSTTAGTPNIIRIAHHLKGPIGSAWRFDRERLYNEFGKPNWFVHPFREEVDVAALELRSLNADVQLHPFDLALADADVLPYPAMSVSIVGFPFGLRPNVFWPIWKTGHVASEYDLDYKENLPAFLIDATTREGMSGSPVVARLQGGHLNRKRVWVVGGQMTRFLGVYSGRLREEAEVGIVWKPETIADILEAEQLAETDA